MSEQIEGRRGEILRMGLGARNWVITHIDEDVEVMTWRINETSKSSQEIVEHIAFTVSIVCIQIAEQLNVDLDMENILVENEDNSFKQEVRSAYVLFKRLCSSMTDEMLDTITTLPPPARLREGTVETVLRIIAGYHSVHHAGQVAMQVKQAKRESKS